MQATTLCIQAAALCRLEQPHAPRLQPHVSRCAPFSPDEIGERVLKLRPAAGAVADREQTLYLRLSTSMHGNRRQLLVRTADTEAGCTLPFLLVNDTPLLLAFRQPGCMFWDLLAAGERTDYVLDHPGGQHALSLRARDLSGRWSSEPTDTISLDQLGRARELPVTCGGGVAAGPMTTPDGAAPLAPPADEPVLMTSACQARYGDADAACADGWLCLTEGHLTFVPFAAAAALLAMHEAEEGWLPLSRLPLDLEELASVDAGARPGELVLTTRTAATLRVRQLRDRDGVAERLTGALVRRAAAREARATVTAVHDRQRARQLARVSQQPQPAPASAAGASSAATSSASASASSSAAAAPTLSPEEELVAMGFVRAPAVEALQHARGALPEAVQLLLDDREGRERVRGELPSLAARSCSGEALRDEHFADQAHRTPVHHAHTHNACGIIWVVLTHDYGAICLRECVAHRTHQVTAQQMVTAELDVSSRRESMSGESGVSGIGGGGSGGGGGSSEKWYPGKLLGQAARSTATAIKSRADSFGRRGRKAGEPTDAERRKAERYAAQLAATAAAAAAFGDDTNDLTVRRREPELGREVDWRHRRPSPTSCTSDGAAAAAAGVAGAVAGTSAGGAAGAGAKSRLYTWQRGERASDGLLVPPMGAVKASAMGVMFVVRNAAGDVGKYIVKEGTAKFPSMGKVSSLCVSQRP